MKKNVFLLTMVAGVLLISSCASKKDLENCQNENRELTANYQNTKEELAASKARVASLEERWHSKRRMLQHCKTLSIRVL